MLESYICKHLQRSFVVLLSTIHTTSFIRINVLSIIHFLSKNNCHTKLDYHCGLLQTHIRTPKKCTFTFKIIISIEITLSIIIYSLQPSLSLSSSYSTPHSLFQILKILNIYNTILVTRKIQSLWL